MEALVRDFLEKNRGRPKLIILGEDHGGGARGVELAENVGKELITIRTLHALHQPFVIYSEMPTNLISRLSPSFTQYYLHKDAERLGIPFKTSNITATCRNMMGSCDNLYETNIQSHLDMGGAAAAGGMVKSELVVAVMGLLHAADMNFPDDIAVLRLNCTANKQTEYALSELKRAGNKKSINTANIIERTLPYIDDPAAILVGESTVDIPIARVASAAARGGPPIQTVSGTKNKNIGGSFKPEWVKNKTGDWVARCPLCGFTSGTFIQALTHRFDCPNNGKKVDISSIPTDGGGRSKTKSKRGHGHGRSRRHRRISRKRLTR